jgi:hypothetical protein
MNAVFAFESHHADPNKSFRRREIIFFNARASIGTLALASAVTGFQAQASGNVSGSDFDELNGVADTGFFDVAVGSYRISGQTIFHALALRFNGRTWSPVTVPTPAGDNTVLNAVTTVTPAKASTQWRRSAPRTRGRSASRT